MAILSLKRWEPVTYEAAPGVQIRMKLKRLKRHESKPLAKVLIACFEEFERSKAEDLTPAQRAAILTQVYEKIPEDVLKGWFATCVKDVEDLEIDGEKITSGNDLLENADDQLLFWLLFRLQQLSKLTSAESNASASPSGSSQLTEGTVGTLADGASPAQSTGSEAGREPSTATATQSTSESSIGQA